MDSFGLDFGSNDILDLGSLGMWGGGSTPVGSSPNGAGLPFSVGTPTGVPSLGDDSFPSLQAGNDDFVFPDSPKTAAAEGANVKSNDGPPSSGISAATSNTSNSASATSAITSLSTNSLLPIISMDSNVSHTNSSIEVLSSSSLNTKSEKPHLNEDDDEDDDDDDFGSSSYFGDDFPEDPNPSSLVGSHDANIGDDSMKQDKGKSSELKEDSIKNSMPDSSHSSPLGNAIKDNAQASDNSAHNSINSNVGSHQQREMAESKSVRMTPNASFNPNMMHTGMSMPMTSTIGSNGHQGLNVPSHSIAMTSSIGGPVPAAPSVSRPHIDSGSMPNLASGPPSNANSTHTQGSVARYTQSGPMIMMSQGQIPTTMNSVSQSYVTQAYSQPVQIPTPGTQSTAPSGNAQYMAGQHPYRPQPANSYDEDLMRVKSMMLQHTDLIPPPMEVLRISMGQSQLNQQNLMSGNYMQQRNSIPQNQNARNGAQYSQFSSPNPGMVMQQSTPTNVVDPNRVQLMQRRMSGSRTPSNNPALDGSSAWQSENDLPLRRKMIGKIVSLLQARKPDAPPEWIRRLPDMARRLEDSLYRTAKNRDEYGDFATLKTRLQHLAVTMGARAQHKAGTTRPPGVIPAGASMMHPDGTPVNAIGVGAGMNSAGHMMSAMPPYNNMGGRMTQQQLMQQQHLIQMQNPQMRQQMTPQQLQHFQAAQMHRTRQYQQQLQQQQQQQVQLQRQASFQQQQQMQQSHMQRQVPTRQQSGPGNNMNQQPQQQSQQQRMQQNQAYMQQQQTHHSNAMAQASMQYRNMNGSMNNSNPNRLSNDLGLPQSFGEASEFLNLELSQSFLTADDLQGADNPTGNSEAGQKRSLSHAQQQMAAAANAAASKRTKVSGSSDQHGMSPLSSTPPSGNNQLQKSVQNSSGSTKTPPMSAVDAK